MTSRWEPRTLVPGLVLVCGLAVVAAITGIGIRELGQQSDQEAALRSELLGSSLAERLAELTVAEQRRLLRRVMARTDAELFLIDAQGSLVDSGAVDGPSALLTTAELLPLLQRGHGEIHTGASRRRFYATQLAAPLESHRLVTLVPAETPPVETEWLLRLVGAFSLALLGGAALVAYVLSSESQADLAYLRRRINELAHTATEDIVMPTRVSKGASAAPADEGALDKALPMNDDTDIEGGVPVRSLDQVGVLTQAFNDLLERFARAAARYRDDVRVLTTLERDKSAFLAALSHELRTPLNVILGFTEVLLSEVEGPLSSDARENLEVVQNSGNTLRELIGDILDLSAIDSGELALNCSWCDVRGIADDVCREHQVVAKKKGLVLKLVGKPVQAWADPLRVHRMIANLVGNAVKFTHKGSVVVHVESRGNQVAISVKDTGPGIPEADRAAIFDDYAQLAGAFRSQGVGLGLAITRRLADMHGGEITLESEVGQGTQFTLHLPKARSSEPPPESGAAPNGALKADEAEGDG